MLDAKTLDSRNNSYPASKLAFKKQSKQTEAQWYQQAGDDADASIGTFAFGHFYNYFREWTAQSSLDPSLIKSVSLRNSESLAQPGH